MKKCLLLLLTFLVCGFAALPLSAQDEESFVLTVADGTLYNDKVPVHGLFADEYQRCQIIYPQAMVSDMANGDISEMTFYFKSSPASVWTGTFNVKLGTCSNAIFGDAFLTGTMTTVYSGTMTLSNNRMIITFTAPYHYEGGNLLVEFVTNAPGNYKSASFYGMEAEGACLQGYNNTDVSAIVPAQQNFIPKTSFTYVGGAACKAPMGLAVVTNEVTAHSATITWDVVEDLVYDVLYWPEEGDTTVLSDVSLDGNTYTIPGLNPNTTYGAMVQAICEDGITIKSSPYYVTFTTLNAPVELPYLQDFETNPGSISEFTFIGTNPSRWFIGSATGSPSISGAAGAHSMYISDDHGNHNQYNTNSISYAYAVLNVTFPYYGLEYRVSFDCNVGGEQNNDYLAVYVIDGTSDIIPTYYPEGNMVSSKIFMTDGWTHKDYGLGDVNGSTKKIVFFWRNDSSDGENPPAAVDNIYIYASSCSQPTNFSVTNVTSQTATLKWHELGGATSWKVYWRTASDVVYNSFTVMDTTYTFTDLDPNTTYTFYVTAVCVDEESGSTETVTITTPNLPMPIPFDLAFEEEDADLFTYINMQSSNVNQWIIGNDVFAPGEGSTTGGSLYISNNGSTYAYSPAANYDAYSYAYMNIEFPEEELEWHLAFDYKVEGYQHVNYYTINKDALSIYLVDATAAIPSSGLPDGAVALVNEAYNVTNWTPRDIVLHDVVGTSKKLLFVWHNYYYNTTPTAPAAIDNLRIYANTCTQPSQLTANVTSNSVTLSWNEIGASESWRVYWKRAVDEEFAMVPVTQTTHTFSNLTPNTAYTFFVVAVCGTEESAATDNLNVTTPGTPVSLPYFEDFETNPESSINDFDTSSTSVNQWSIGAATGMPDEDAEEAHSLYISNDNGVSNVYTGDGSETDAYAILNVEFPDDNLEYHIEFDYNVEGEGALSSKWDYFSVYLLDPTMDMPTNTSTAENALIYRSNKSDGWQHFSSILENVNGEAKSLVFYWRNDNSGTYNPPIAIDNIRIEGMACPLPMNLQVTATSTNSVTVEWSLMSDTSCTVEYGPAGFEHGQGTMVSGILGGTYTVGGLTPTVPYDVYVRSDCGSGWQGPLYVILGQHEMQAGSDTLYTCNSVIFDDGGATGNYSNSFDGILVLYPETPGSMMMVTGECQIELNGDTLKIYDGVGVGGVLLGSYSGTLQDIAVTSTTGPLTIRFKSDGLSAYPGFELRAQCVTCLTPSNLNVTAITADSAMLTWTPVEDTYSWLVEYKSTLATEWQSQIVLEEPNVQLSGLEPGTSYEVKVSTACDDGVYSYPVQTNFATLLSSTPLPYETDFTETADRNWLLNNGTCINRWMIGNVTDTENALYISNNGSDAAYTWTATSVVSAEKLFLVGAAANVDIAFDLQVGGESFYDYLKVFFAPENADFSASTSATDFSANSDTLYAVDFSEYAQYSHYSQMASYPYIISRTDTNKLHIEVMMPNPNATPTATSTAKLVFVWVNDNSNGKDPGAIISNVSVAATTCAKPSDLTVSNITGHTAGLAWTGSANAWYVEYKKSNSNQWISVDDPAYTPDFTLTDLDPTTRYDVRVQAACGEEQRSLFVKTSFTTVEACPVPTNILVTATNTQAVVTWNGNADNYTVECGTYPVSVEGNTATITGLTSATLYTVIITAICDGEGTSDPVTLNFMTDCDVVNSFPYTEGFENGLGCWTSVPVIDTKNWYVSDAYTASNAITTPPVQGDSMAYYKPNAYGTATDLVSPTFDLTALQNPKISFYHIHKPYGSDVDTMKVYYKNSPTAEPVLLAGYNGIITYWKLDSISLPNPTAEYQIIFRGFGAWGFGIGLDSITVFDRPGAAPELTPPTVVTDTAVNVTDNAATLKATIINQDNVPILAQGFQWRIMIGGTYDFVPATVTDNAMSAELTDLAPETAYRFRAYVITATDTIYGELKNFTTLEEEVEPCAAPTGLGTTNITKESITVSWDAAVGVSSWNLRYRKQGDEQFITKNTESHTYVINNLLPETTYEIQVQADCGDDNESQWSELITETTLPDDVGVNSYLENSIVLYPNPAKEVVNVQCTMNNVQFNGAKIEVLDVYGKLLQTLKVSSETTRINVSGLANGMYFVRVTTEQGAVTKRFVKQ